MNEKKSDDNLLSLSDITVGYGDITVLWDVHVAVKENEIVGIVGANGAGKSTIINTISGLLNVKKGTIRFKGQDITNMTPSHRVKFGITQIPEGRQLFSGLTVHQNLMMGAFTRRDQAKIEEDLQWVFELFPVLRERSRQLAGTLSGGEQQMCAIGRGLMSSPRLLLIDELSLGLAPIVVDGLVQAIQKIHLELKLGIVLVEQDVQTGLELSNRGYVLETGRIVKEGDPQSLLGDPEIKKAYLGI